MALGFLKVANWTIKGHSPPQAESHNLAGGPSGWPPSANEHRYFIDHRWHGIRLGVVKPSHCLKSDQSIY
jgi:hypothetical protein